MEFINKFILSIVQGISEFLPISSSGHLLLLKRIFNLNELPIQFDILLHLASALAIFFYFYKKIIDLCIHFFDFRHFNLPRYYQKNRFSFYLIISTGCTLIIAFIIDRFDFIPWIQEHPYFLSIFFFFSALILYLTKFFPQGTQNLNIGTSIVLGILQGVAVLPGISRSGILLAFGIFYSLKINTLREFTFLSAIPIILASFIWKNMNIWSNPINYHFSFSYLFFFFLCFFVSLISLYCLNLILKRNHIYCFAYYLLIPMVINLFI